MTSPSSPPSSSSLRDYRVLSLLGEGTFGRVSLVSRVRDGSLFVWKELHYGSMSDKEKSQLVNEVNLLRELRHQNIVAYHDRLIDRDRRIIYIIMEYCSGGDLSAMIKTRRKSMTKFSSQFIFRVLGELCSAINVCHQRSCVHRDIKPGNVLIDERGVVKLCDFGLARLLSASSNNAQTHAGTPYYMSPEQIIHSRASEKSDAWALGCLAYELCTLRPPFTANNHLALARAIEKGEFDDSSIINDYGGEMARMIRGLLTVDTKKRWSIAQLSKQQKIQNSILINNPSNPITKTPPMIIKSANTNSPQEISAPVTPNPTIAFRERALAERERLLIARESECEEKEKLLNQREEKIRQREIKLRNSTINNFSPPPIVSATSTTITPIKTSADRIAKLKRLTPISQATPTSTVTANKENFENKRTTQMR